MKARLIQMVDGKLMPTEFTESADLIAAIEIRGFAFNGLNANPRQRAELQGQPKFRGLCGPMWDGDGIRYEDQASYNALSA